MDKPTRREMLRFLGAGALNTVFGFSVYAAALWCGLSYVWAALIAQIAGALFNYLTYGLLVFRQKLQRKGLVRFLFQYTVLYGLSIALLTILQNWGFNAYLSGILSTLFMAFFTYLASKFFSFRTQKGQS